LPRADGTAFTFFFSPAGSADPAPGSHLAGGLDLCWDANRSGLPH
jgi:hypothetical protein